MRREGFTTIIGVITAKGANYIKALLRKVLYKHMTGEGPCPVLSLVSCQDGFQRARCVAVIVFFVMDCAPAGARGLNNTSSAWIKLK